MSNKYLNIPLHRLMTLWDKKKFPHTDLPLIKEAVMLRDKEDSFYPSIQYKKSVKLAEKHFGHSQSSLSRRLLSPYHFITIALELEMFEGAFRKDNTYFTILADKPHTIGGVKYSYCMLLEYDMSGAGDFNIHKVLKIGKEFVYLSRLIRLSSQRNAKKIFSKLCLYRTIFEKSISYDGIYSLFRFPLGRVTLLELVKIYLPLTLQRQGVEAVAGLEEKRLNLMEFQNILFKLSTSNQSFFNANFGNKNKAIVEFIEKVKNTKKV